MAQDNLDDLYTPEQLSEADREYFAKSGFGNRMGWGDSPALLVVDMTEEFTSDEYSLGRGDTGTRAIANVKGVLDASREAELPIYYTRPNGDYPGAYMGVWAEKKHNPTLDARPGNDVPAEIEPREDEVVIDKGKPSAFFGTHLADMLRYDGVDTVVVTGMVTSGCIRATVIDACSHNFKTIIPEECVADRADISHEVNLFEMDLKYGDVVETSDVIEKLAEFQ